MAELIDRRGLKIQAEELLRGAQVPPGKMVALYMGLAAVLSLIDYLGGGPGLLSTFLTILTELLSLILSAGFVFYCMAIRRGERAEYGVLFDGFGMVGKIVLLTLVQLALIFLWSMLFVIPGVVAMYRYRYALFNLLEDPEIGVMEAISMSKQQTQGYKWQLFLLDLSYLGWMIIASLPSYLYQQILSWRLREAILAAESMPGMMEAMNSISYTVWGIPALGWQIFISLWALVAALFYLAAYQCVELDYFAISKRTSGVGLPPEESGTAPLDGWNDSFGGSGGSSDGGFYP